MSTIATLILIQTCITRYALSTILALGNLGNLLTIIIYSQKKHRTNPCSIYLIAVSCFCLMGSNWAIAPTVYALDHFDMVSNSLILCRIRGYIIHTSSMCFRYTLVVICADRYAVCSRRISIRALSRPQIAYRSIAIITLFWSMMSVHLLIWESIENGHCGVYGIYGQIFSFYIAICTGFIPIVLMTSFSILLVKNLNSVRLQIVPTNNNNVRLNRRDVSFIKLILVEVVVYIICTILYPPVTIYSQVTSYMVLNKTAERKQIESFITFITMSLLLYLNYNTTFYVHFITSRAFRQEVKQLFLKYIRRSQKNVLKHQNGLKTINTVPERQQLRKTTTI
ncbi:unnamed protein product [Adineta steineri]|uniref:G-protein coupled receptors family 1 profile domain-containing protein n=1 Tax=Adineta steineri TaxID=433720 RepID=A0A818Y465_9BILA|nr:unnamed protein product [Adineta steineri]CAF3748475.1 unnamed protein product [Adineta steineri]